MHAKRLLYVSAGILCLALAYHLGASSATAQGSSWRVVGDNLVVSGNALYRADDSGWTPQATGPVPPSQVLSAWWDNGMARTLITTSGEGWMQSGSYPGGWGDIGPVPGATAAAKSSWGQLKVRYR